MSLLPQKALHPPRLPKSDRDFLLPGRRLSQVAAQAYPRRIGRKWRDSVLLRNLVRVSRREVLPSADQLAECCRAIRQGGVSALALRPRIAATRPSNHRPAL